MSSVIASIASAPDSRASRNVYGVLTSQEFYRIRHLPRRTWEDDPDVDELVDLLTAHLRVPGTDPVPTRVPARLRPVQAMALRDCHDQRGLLAPVGVGVGKTLLSLLIPTVLNAKRPLLIVPARRRQPTREAIDVLSFYWRILPTIDVIGYSEVSGVRNVDLLYNIRPDVIVLDEAHRLKSPKSARTKRFGKYIRDNPNTVVAAMSGTITQRSLKDFSHISRWCLGDQSPVPYEYKALVDWCCALDSKVPDNKRIGAGVLTEFCQGAETVREGYNRRLRSTPGVVASTGPSDVQATLTVRKWSYKPPDEITEALRDLEDLWETPNGDLLTEATEMWRHARTMAQGYWMRWDPPAPQEWLVPRKEWNRVVREELKGGQYDSPFLVWQAWRDAHKDGAPRGDDHCPWCDWEAVKGSFKPNPVATWYNHEVSIAAVDWLRREKGIVWVDSPHIGKEVARRAGVVYYGSGDAAEDMEKDRRPFVASINAHGEGANLQFHHHRGLVLATPTTGKRMEQLLGRMHRTGQTADEVIYELYLGSEALMEAFHQCREDALYLEQVQGTVQKLNIADVEVTQ